MNHTTHTMVEKKKKTCGCYETNCTVWKMSEGASICEYFECERSLWQTISWKPTWHFIFCGKKMNNLEAIIEIQPTIYRIKWVRKPKKPNTSGVHREIIIESLKFCSKMSLNLTKRYGYKFIKFRLKHRNLARYIQYHMWEYFSVLSYTAHCFHIYFGETVPHMSNSKVILCLKKTSYIEIMNIFTQNVFSSAIFPTALSLKWTICNLNQPFEIIFNCKWNQAWPVNCWNVR